MFSVVVLFGFIQIIEWWAGPTFGGCKQLNRVRSFKKLYRPVPTYIPSLFSHIRVISLTHCFFLHWKLRRLSHFSTVPSASNLYLSTISSKSDHHLSATHTPVTTTESSAINIFKQPLNRSIWNSISKNHDNHLLFCKKKKQKTKNFCFGLSKTTLLVKFYLSFVIFLFLSWKNFSV